MSAGGLLAAAAVPVVAANVPSFMQFTAAEWAMIIGAIGLVITNWRQGNKTEKVIQAVVGTETSRGVIGKLDQIHEASNSTLTAVRADYKTLNAKLDASIAANAALQTIIADLQVQRDKVAQIAINAAVAEKTTVQPAAQAAPPTPAAPVAPPVIVVENVTAENIDAKTVRAGSLTTGHKEEKK